MIRLSISAEAYRAIAGEDPPPAPQGSPWKGVGIWLDPMTVQSLKAARKPGEGYSEAIIRIARETA